jgi:hypothetical protein
VDRLIALVLLRWRTDLRALGWARERILGLVLMVPGLLVFSALGSLLAFFGLRTLERHSPEAVLPLISVAATAIGVFWCLSPLLAGVAFSESHDMSRLLHFPIPLATLVGSSLLANLSQPMVLAEMPILLAVSLATAGGVWRLPLALTGVSLSFAFILAAAQVSGLLLHGLSRNRRLHDAALFVGLGAGLLLSLAPILILAGGGRSLASLVRVLTAADLFAPSPFAWGARAAVHAGRGELLPFLAFAGLGVVAIAGAMALSAGLIHKIHRGELDLGTGGATGDTARARMMFAGALGALLEKDLRSGWRDPALKAALLMGLVGPLLFLFLLTRTRAYGQGGSAVLMLASFVGMSSFGANALGLERRGISLLMGFPVPRWRILVGKNMAALLFRTPGLLTMLVAGSFMAPAALLPAAVTIALVTLMTASGVDNYMSILFPIAAPGPGSNPYGGAGSGGRGLGAAATGALFFVAALLLSVPFAFLAWLPHLLRLRWLWLACLPLALAGAVSVYAMLVAGAAELLRRREPELLERILGEA